MNRFRDIVSKISPSKQKDQRSTLLFIALSVGLMLIVHFVTSGAWMTHVPPEVSNKAEQQSGSHFDPKDSPALIEAMVTPDFSDDEFEDILQSYYGPPAIENEAPQHVDVKDMQKAEKVNKAEDVEKVEHAQKSEQKPGQKSGQKLGQKLGIPAYKPLRVEGSPKIAIIIDDMGVNRKRSHQIIELDAPLTLAFLPYADGLNKITKHAQKQGHELMIHMPMQAVKAPVSLGPIALKTGMDEEAVKDNMLAAFESFDGYVGLNNHMGSQVTQDPEIMGWVMDNLKDRGLYFIDSRTIGSSIAAETAQSKDIPTAIRDVFLDHETTRAFVSKALRKVERTAAKKGYAIAIGHPKTATIEGLRGWIDDVRSRGFEIVHVSALLDLGQDRPVSIAKGLHSEDKGYPKAILSDVLADTQPNMGDESSSSDLYNVSGVSDGGGDDPNSRGRRAKIFEKMLRETE